MNKRLKTELSRIEDYILEKTAYGRGCGKMALPTAEAHQKDLRCNLSRRRDILNQLFECLPEEVELFEKINGRLGSLTELMHAKALSLYRAILEEGYDRSFDDDITVEGRLRYVFCSELESVTPDEKGRDRYGSRFAPMLDIISHMYEDGGTPECAFCQTSYSLSHRCGMSPSEFGLDNFLDDGDSWNEGPLGRPELSGICICHAVHDLCNHKLCSIPDLLRMNDFWVDVTVTYQHMEDQDGRRTSFIERAAED